MKEWDRVIRKTDGEHGVIMGSDFYNSVFLVRFDNEEIEDAEVPKTDLRMEDR